MLLSLLPLRVLSRQILSNISPFHTTSIHLSKRKVLHRFRLADIGEGITECEVIKWIVKPASLVQSFDPLCEVQSDKASVEITSPFDGIIKDLLVKEGDVAKVGEGLCLIEVEEDASEEASITSPEAEATLSQVHASRQITKLTTQPEFIRDPHPLDPSHIPSFGGSVSSQSHVLATPSVRHFARQKGIDLAAVGIGSGKGGRIEKKDVETFLSASSESSRPSASRGSFAGEMQEMRVDFSRTRFAMWKAMVKSLGIPHFGYSTTLDLTRISELLPTLNAYIPPIYTDFSSKYSSSVPQVISPNSIFPKPPTPVESDSATHYSRLTFLPLLLKTLSRAMLEWPLFRASISSPLDSTSKEKPTFIIRPHADIAIALTTPTGLYTPTLGAVETLSPYAIMGRLRRLQYLGRQTPCALGPADMPKRGGTLTVSNVGAIGKGDFAAPLLIPGGGVAIVAIGRAKWVDVVPEDGLGPTRRRLLVGVSWSADHRVIEGAEIAAFVEAWRDWVEHPERLIGDSV